MVAGASHWLPEMKGSRQPWLCPSRSAVPPAAGSRRERRMDTMGEGFPCAPHVDQNVIGMPNL